MNLFKRKLLSLARKLNLLQKINCNKFIFYFLFGLKNKYGQFKININTNCLVLSQYPGAETKGLGGLIAQYPKNFEVLCFTNGSTMIPELDPVTCASVKKQQFSDVMKERRVKGFKIFDIDDKTLKNHFSTFRKIDISDADYIFVPNVYDSNPDTIALLKHFKALLDEKEHKKDLKIVMFESDFPLCYQDYCVNISSIIGTKRKMLSQYYPKDKFPYVVEKTIGLNAFRSLQLDCDFVETFMVFDEESFYNIPLI